MGAATGLAVADDRATSTLSFAGGSMGTIHCLANGHESFPKEQLEVFCAGRILQLDNFCPLKSSGWPKYSKMRRWRQEKGQSPCVAAFVEAVRKGLPPPIAFDGLIKVTWATFEIQKKFVHRQDSTEKQRKHSIEGRKDEEGVRVKARTSFRR
jgi:predicted dehydrogenase